MTDALTGEIAGARFRFVTDNRELTDYGRQHLARSLCPADDIDVDVVLRWHEGLPPLRDATGLGSLRRVDRDLYLGDGVLRWFRVDDLRDLQLAFTWDGRRLRVEGDFYFRVGNRALADRLRRLLARQRTTAQRRRRYTTLLSYLVYYPCWWWLEHMRGFHPIHAAGVVGDRGGIVIAGGSGVGKSTLSVLLGLQPGARFLSDSFLLHRGPELWPVREPLLIDAAGQRWLEGRCAQLEPITWGYLLGRNGFHFPTDRLADEGRAGLLLFPGRSPKPYWRAVAPQKAAAWLSAGDMIINDLRRYWSFAAVLEYLAADGLMARREQNVRALVDASVCYEIGLNLEQSSTELAHAVAQLCEALPAADVPRQRTA